MALKRQRRAQIFQEEECLVSNETSYISSVIQNEQRTFTLPNNIITDFSVAQVLCDLHCMMNKSLTPYLHCTRLLRVTAPQPPELISRAVASF